SCCNCGVAELLLVICSVSVVLGAEFCASALLLWFA
ncbi:hypothetical protein A2U01_0092184, partial [Trifolium medium]|nr:hypothetical protein [Trifolium medium]